MVFTAAQLRQITTAAENSYPRECCGLLVGRDGETGAALTVTRVEPAANLSDRPDRFELDPAARLRVMRETGTGPERLIGHYHSHPDHPARPSAQDLSQAWEPDLVWVICAVHAGEAGEVAAFRVAEGGKTFTPLEIRVT